jgi:uncharacterized protein YqjF (DUF2071 family)
MPPVVVGARLSSERPSNVALFRGNYRIGTPTTTQPSSASTVFLTAEWRWLAMLNYRVSADVLAPLVPRGTTLDLWQGTPYVSVVGFLFERIRVLGVPLPTHRRFEEVNLRFYVARNVADEVRHGVTFIRELVPRRLIATAATLTYNEPYRRVPMFHHLDVGDSLETKRASYEWRDGPKYGAVRVDAERDGKPLVAGSFEDFLTHREWGYTRQRDGSTVEYRVDHPRWTAFPAIDAQSAGPAIASAFGEGFAEIIGGGPDSAWLSDGSAVVVHRPVRLLNELPS